MKRNRILPILILVLALVLAGCGKPSAPESIELTEWTMNATAWSSPNGATVNLTATPNGYSDSQSAQFIVRLEGDEVANVPCQWDGKVLTASADLNAADGYCYYVILTDTDGTQTEVSVNTPTDTTDESLVNMETALSSYCEVSVEEAGQENGKLSISKGSATIHLPWLTLDEGPVTCLQAVLVLSHNGAEASRAEISGLQTGDDHTCLVDLSGTSFAIPDGIDDDHQLSVRLDVTLSNGHQLTAPGGNWYYLDGNLLMAVG